jgi:hypothetical protein
MVERREDAEADPIARRRAYRGTMLLPFLSQHTSNITVAGAIFGKRRARGAYFRGDRSLAASTVQLAWATADTKLPPFTATRACRAPLQNFTPPIDRGARGGIARPEAVKVSR